MKFSVITVTYQDDLGLKKTLKSLSKIDKHRYELIIIDGGSKDKTLQIINENSAFIDRWVSEPDQGIYDAMNKGLKLVNDKENIVSFLNAGDLALDNYFEDPKRCFLENRNINYCYGGVILVGKKKESVYLPKIFDKKSEYLQRMVFSHPALFVKKNIFLKIGDFNLNKKITADHEWCVRLIKSGVKGKRFDSPVVEFKLGGASLKLSAQFEVFQTALQYNRNIIIAVFFLARQLISRFYYIYKSKC
jgi:glycosyltransferase involved in cell wall biosynthesis